MELEVAPLLQMFPVEAEEVKVTLSPWQKVVAPLAVMVGVVGTTLTTTGVVADIKL
jgi:hypothetical protein